MDWIDLASDRDQWKALINIVINLWIPKSTGKFLSSVTTGGLAKRA
jgi:hypothetical protein